MIHDTENMVAGGDELVDDELMPAQHRCPICARHSIKVAAGLAHVMFFHGNVLGFAIATEGAK